MNVCKIAHCWHAHRSLLARLIAATSPWVVVRCCSCKRRKVKWATTPHVKAP